MRTISPLALLVPVLALPLLVACETAPAGPGQTIDAEDSSISLTHPLYPDVKGEYGRRSGQYGSQSETATFFGTTGAILVSYDHTSGDTYVSAPSASDVAEVLGSDPDTNKISAEGDLPGTFPVVHWASYRATGEDGQPISCVTIVRNGNSSNSAGIGYTSAVIVATECRGAHMEMTEREAAILSGSVRIK